MGDCCAHIQTHTHTHRRRNRCVREVPEVHDPLYSNTFFFEKEGWEGRKRAHQLIYSSFLGVFVCALVLFKQPTSKSPLSTHTHTHQVKLRYPLLFSSLLSFAFLFSLYCIEQIFFSLSHCICVLLHQSIVFEDDTEQVYYTRHS